MATMTEARIQIKLQRLEGFEDQVRVSVLDQGVGVASGKSICVDSEEAARMVGQLYSRSRERGTRISLEVATLPNGLGLRDNGQPILGNTLTLEPWPPSHERASSWHWAQ